MIANVSKYIFFIKFLLLMALFQSVIDGDIVDKGKCIYMISDSSAYNFHYLKKGQNDKK